MGVEDVSIRRPTLDDVFISLTGRSAEEDEGAGAGVQEREAA